MEERETSLVRSCARCGKKISKADEYQIVKDHKFYVSACTECIKEFTPKAGWLKISLTEFKFRLPTRIRECDNVTFADLQNKKELRVESIKFGDTHLVISIKNTEHTIMFSKSLIESLYFKLRITEESATHSLLIELESGQSYTIDNNFFRQDESQ